LSFCGAAADLHTVNRYKSANRAPQPQQIHTAHQRQRQRGTRQRCAARQTALKCAHGANLRRPLPRCWRWRRDNHRGSAAAGV